MSAAEPRPSLTRAVALSASSGPNLIAWGMLLGAGWLLGNLWVATLGSVLYVLLIARNSTSPRFWRRLADRDAELARQLPADGTLTNPTLMVMAASLRKGYDEIVRVLKEVPPAVQRQLSAPIASLDDVRAQAAQLLREADVLGRYLLTAPAEATRKAMEKLNRDLAGSSDDGVSLEYGRALSVRQEHLAAVAQVTREHDRIVAALQLILGTVEAFPAWIYRMSVLEARAKEDRVSEVNDELRDLTQELATAQQLLEGLAPARCALAESYD